MASGPASRARDRSRAINLHLEVRSRRGVRDTWRTRDTLPPLFSREFVTRVHTAVEAGRLSLRRAARLPDIDVPDLAEICRAYGLSLSYEV